MNNIENVLIPILSILPTAMLVVLIIKTSRRDTIYKIVLSFVVKAEKELGSKTGDLKYARVIENLYGRLPTIVRWMFSKKEIDEMIIRAVNYVTLMLENDIITLDGYEEESNKKNSQ